MLDTIIHRTEDKDKQNKNSQRNVLDTTAAKQTQHYVLDTTAAKQTQIT